MGMIGVSMRKTGRFLTNPRGVVKDLQGAVESALRVVSLRLYQMLDTELSSPQKRDPFWGVLGGRPGLGRRTGRTRRRLSPGGRVYRTAGKAWAAVGSPDQHVLDAEEGGAFTHPSGFWRIPTAAAQMASGVDRWADRSIRDIPGAHLYRNPISHQLWAYQALPGTLGKAGHVLLYLLKKTIHREGRHVWARTTRALEPFAVQQVGAKVSVAVQKANS